MKKKFIKTPLVGVLVHGAKDVGTRTVNLLMGEHAGEYVRGDIMDANAVIQAFDELKGNVDNNHDSLEEIVNEIHNFRDTTNHRFDVFQEKAEEETANRILGDNTLDEKIDQKESESNERDNVLQLNIDTEKQERVNADTQLRNDLAAEVNRAKASENALSSDIQAEATKRENDDNTIKDNLNAEVTRATAKENEIKAEVDVINGDSTTEGSFRKAIADVVGAAPEAYDTLKEIADKLNSNDDLHAAINDAIATKATTVALNEEIIRAKAAEAENKAEIAAEAARAKEVEGDNALAIQNEASRATTAETAINESLNTEIDRAKGQETYLQNLVNAKADTTALNGAKAELDKKISDETTRATLEEDELRSLITTEQNRATASEKSITDDLNGKLVQKADTTALNNYVLTTVFNTLVNSITAAINSKAETTALTALEQKVTANTAAIDTKQPKGNYLTEHQSLEEYAKKTDIPAVDTSDFVSKTTTDDQIINSTLGIVGGGGIQIVDYTLDGDPVFMILGSSVLNFDGNNRSTIELNSSCVDSNNGSHIVIEAYNENPLITLSDSATFRNYLTITKEGISSTDNNANRVYATDGSIADLTQYAKKSEIAAGANVDDIQVNGVSVVENKIANIKPSTKESLGVVKVGNGLNVTDGTISVDTEYLVDMMSYGVEWDTTVADPACTRIGNQLYHKLLPIQSLYKGCLVKNGVVNYYLDPNDWSRKADGTPSVLDGTDGDVMVHIPKFYGKSGSNGNKRWVRISTTKIDSSWVEIPEMFVSAYRITTYTDTDKTKVASVVNTTANYRGGSNRLDNDQYLDTDKFRTDLGKPRTNVSRSTMRTNANNSGQELLCYEYYKWIFYWAYVIEYANFNSLKEFNSELTSDGCHLGGLGSGVTNWDYTDWLRYNGLDPITPCGYTNEFGNFSGVKQILIPQTQIDDSTTINEKTLYANRWRGFENPFGDIWTNLDGIVLKRDSANAESKVYTTSDSSKFGDDTSVMNVVGVEVAEEGYTKEFDLRETGEIIPQLVGGSESIYKCDYHWCNELFTDKRTLLVCGLALHGGEAGLGAFYSNNGVDLAHSFVGFRSVVRA